MSAGRFRDLDRTIHERGRLAIAAVLSASGELSFSELKETLRLTDGNLITHLRALEAAGYVRMRRATSERGRSRTLCALTAAGRRAFARYVEVLGEILAPAPAAGARGKGAAPRAPRVEPTGPLPDGLVPG